MPSARLTKTNIDRGRKAQVAAEAARQGISATKMLDTMIQFYLSHKGKTNNAKIPNEPKKQLARST